MKSPLIYVGIGIAAGYLVSKYVFAPKKSNAEGKKLSYRSGSETLYNRGYTGYSNYGGCGA